MKKQLLVLTLLILLTGITSYGQTISGYTAPCLGSTYPFTIDTVGGTWSSSNVAKATIDVTSGILTPVASGATTISYNLPAATYTLAVTVSSLSLTPITVVGGPPFSMCVGVSRDFNNVTGGGTWSSSTPAKGTINSGTGLVGGVSAGSTTITYHHFGGCKALQQVAINEVPVIISGPVCLNSVTPFTATPAGGTWSSNNPIIASVDVSGNVTGNVAGGANISYTLSSGCVKSQSVVVNQVPNVVTGIQGVCQGNTTTFSSTTAGMTWSSSNTSVATAATATTTTGLITGVSPGTSLISYTNSFGCPRTLVVTVNAPLDPNVGPTHLCIGQNVTFTNSTSGGTWNSSAPATVSIVSGTGAATPLVVGNANITYSITSPSCRTITPVTVNATLPANTVIGGGSATVCIGLTISLANSTPGGVWSSSNGNATVVGSTGAVTGVSNGTSVITYAFGSGCFKTTIVTINPAPTAIGGSPFSVCVGSALTLTNGIGGGTWLSSNIAVGTIGASSGILTGITNGTTLITYQLAATGCEVTQEVTVNPLPNAITGTLLVCQGGTTALAATPGPGTWSSSNVAVGTVASGTGIVSALSAGTTIISYILTATGCYNTAVLTVNALPTVASITPSSNNLCIGADLTLTAGAETGAGSLISYNWTGPNSYATTTAINSAVFTTTTVASSGEYSLTVTYTGLGCTSTVVATNPAVTVNALPTVTSITTSSNLLCAGANLTLTGNGATGTGTITSYNWTGPNSYSTTTAGNTSTLSSVTTAASGEYSLTVTYPGTGCTSAGVVTTPAVTVNPLPTVTSITTSSNLLCEGANLTLTGNGATGTGTITSYNWSGPNSYSTTTAGNTSTLSSVTTAASGQYSLTVTYAGTGCTSTGVVTTPLVTVNPLPTVTSITTSSNLLCAGANLTLTGNGATGTGTITSYNWSGPNSYSTTTAGNTSTLSSVTTAASGQYSLTVTYAGTGCTSTGVVTTPLVTVNPLPTVTSITTSSNLLCAGANLTLTGNGATGTGTITSYNWSGPNSYSTTTAGNTATLSSVTTAASGQYSLTVTYAGTGCTSTGVVTTPAVTVNPLPTVTSITTSSNLLCEGANLTLTGNGATGIGAITSYNWSGPNSYSTTTAGNTSILSSVTTAASGQYSLTVTYAGTGCTSTGVVTTPLVTVNPLPTVTSITTSSNLLCEGANLTLTGNGATGTGTITSYNWSGPNSYSTTTAGNTATLSSVTTAASGQYSLTVTYPGTGCTSTGVVTTPLVTVNPLPTVTSITTSSNLLCAGANLTLTGNGATGTGAITSYNWSGPNSYSTTTAGNTATLSSVTTAASGQYSLTVTYAGTGCTSTGVVTTPLVTVNPLPTVTSITTSSNLLCAGANLTLTGNGATGTGAITSYNWTGPNSYSTTTAGNTATLSSVTTAASGQYSLTVTYAGTGCTSTGVVTTPLVTVNPLPTVTSITTSSNLLCAGANLTLTGNGATGTGAITSYNWSGPNSYSTTTAGNTATLSSVTTAASGQYSLTVTYAGTGCTSTGVVTTPLVTVNPLPTVTSITTSSNLLCEGANLTLTGNGATGTGAITSYNWSGPNSYSTTTAGNTATLSSVTTAASGQYSLTVTYAGTGCTSTGVVTTPLVTVNPLPTVTSITTSSNLLCEGANLTLTGNGATGTGTITSYNWSGPNSYSTTTAGNTSTLSSVTTAASGQYSLTVTYAGTGCTSTGVVTTPLVTVNPLPTVTSITTSSNLLCEGANLTLTGNGSTGTGAITSYNWSGPNSYSTTTAGNTSTLSSVTTAASGQYSLTVTYAGTGCTSTGVVTTPLVTVNPLPTVTSITTSSNLLCEGANLTLTGNGATGTGAITSYNWSGPNSYSSTTAGNTSTLSSVTTAASGQYSLTVTYAGTGCTSTGVVTTPLVTVNPLPTVTSITTSSNLLCEGANLTLTGNGATGTGAITSYNWSGPNSYSTTTAGNTSTLSSVTTAASGQYSLTVTYAGTGCTSTGVVTTPLVTVNPLPTVTSITTSSNLLCAGANLTLTGNGATGTGTITSYNWSGPNSYSTTTAGNTATLSSVTTAASGQYSLTVTYAGTGCTSTGVVTTPLVTVNPLPTVTSITTSSNLLCAGANLTLTGNGATGTGAITSYNWSGPNSYSTTTAGNTATLSSVTTAASGQYSLTVTYAGTGCTSTGVVTTPLVTVNPLPTVTSITTSSNLLCAGANLTLTGNGATGTGTITSYNWSGPNSYSTTTAGNTATLSSVTTAASGQYSLTVTYAGTGCTSTGVVTTPLVTVNPLPTVTSITTSSNLLCEGANLTLTGNGATGTGAITSYNWSGPNSYSTTTAGNTATLSSVTTAASGQYSLTVTYAGTGCTSTGVVTTPLVTVNPLPTVTSITTSSNLLCEGANLTLTGNGATGTGTITSYNWSGPNSYSTTTAGNTSTLSSVTTAASGQYSLTVTYAGTGCTSTGVVTTPLVTVNPLPTVTSITTSSNLLCEGANLTLTGNGATGTGTITSYNWSGPNSYSTTTAGNTSTLSSVTTAASGQYSLTVTYAGTGCTSTGVVTTPAVTVNPLPTVTSITTSSNLLCEGASLTLTGNGATGTGTITSYNWTGPNSYSTTTAGNTATLSSVTTAASGQYSLTVTYAGTGCTSTGVITTPAVTVNPLPTVTSITTSSNLLCEGANLTLTGNGATGTGTITSYNWSGPNSYSTTTVGNTSTLSSVTTAASGDYSLTVTYAGTGCTSTGVVTTPAVTVNPLPTVTSITTSSNLLCAGANLTLTGNGATGTGTITSYNWSGPNSYSTTTAGNTSTLSSVTTAASGDYSLTVTYAGTGCTSTGVATTPAVTVNPLPTVTSITTSSNLLCEGANLTLTGNGATGTGAITSYNWSGPNSYSTTTAGNTATLSSVTTAASGQYSLTVTYAGTGCTSTGVVTTPLVTVNPLPTVTSITTSSNLLCEGANLTLTGNGATGTGTITSYNWSGPNSYSTTTAGNTATLSSVTTAASGDYSLTVTYAGTGCTSTGVVTTPAVTVNPLPTVTSITTSSNLLCEGANLTLTGNGATGTGTITSYNWSGPNSYSTTTAGNTATLSSVTTAASGQYSLTVTYAGTGCTSTGVVITPAVTVNPLPTVTSITPSSTLLCAGANLTLTGNGATGTGALTSYNWSGPNSYSTTTAGNTATLSSVTTAASGEYSLTVTYPGTGCTSTAVVTTPAVTVNVLPTVSGITALPTTICEGAVLTLTGSGATGSGTLTSYNWSGPNSYSSTTAGSVQTYTVPALTASGIYSLTVTYTGTGCTSMPVMSSPVSVVPRPTVYNVTGGGVMCADGLGVHIGLDWSVLGIEYQLYNGAVPYGLPVAGATSAIDFGLITVAGTYSVVARNIATSCVRDMAGSATVTVNPVPVAYSVTGSGMACENTGGVAVGLANSETGISYQLYNGASAVGSSVAGNTGVAISFGSQTASGTYTVLATNDITFCTSSMTGSAAVTINPAPTAFAVTGTGGYCTGGAGLPIGLANSTTGIEYQLYNGAATVGFPVAGNTGSAISFGTHTLAATYTVLATNTSTMCTGPMSGSAVITMNPLPAPYTVTGGGQYCAGGTGVTVGLSFSTTGVNYQLYNGSTASGLPVGGTGVAISFGSQTAAGTYTVRATNATTACTSDMTGSVAVVMNPLPIAQNVTGGGHFCTGGAGVPVGLDNSETGVKYQLYNGTSTVGALVDGTGAAISFSMQATAGTYTVRATNTTSTCVNDMTGSATVSLDPLPTIYVVTGGGNYCAGGSGVVIGLNGSDAVDISYQLYNGATASGSPVMGTGAAISFGTRTATGTYSVVAVNTVTACTSNMFGTTPVVIDPLPTPETVTGGGNYCSGGAGLPIGLAASNSGISYQLYNGAAMVGMPVGGTGVAISFGIHTASGTYTVLATNSITTCTNAMTGSATIVIDPLPTPQTVNGGGTYCENAGGVLVGLDGSQTPNISYQLYVGATAMGSAVNGTGAAISFGSQTLAGTYTVLATNTVTTCTRAMTGNAVVIMNPAPTAYLLTGGGHYCAEGSGLPIGLANSNTGISYQLYNGAAMTGFAVTGTGSPISFGTFTAAGTYSVLATNTSTLCTNPMGNTTTIVIDPLPIAYNVTGGGQYCAGGAGVTVGVSNTNTGINYQLYRGATMVGSSISGTGAAISFGLQSVAGTYSVLATDAITFCTKPMLGSSVVIMNPLPVANNVYGGGNSCVGGAGVNIGVDMTQTGVNYRLYLGSTIMAVLGGTSAGIDFGMMYSSGVYTVLAVNATTGCSFPMTGSATVTLNTPPAAFVVTGGGSYCSGGSGVAVGLNGSASGVNYKLYLGASIIGGIIPGTGSAISFGTPTASGTYTVLATHATSGCSTAMTGNASVGISALPAVYAISGGGVYCPGTTGANIGLEGSASGVNYQLYIGSTAVGTPVSGTGVTLNLGTYTTVGTYSIVATDATTGCSSNMSGTATVATYSLPLVYNVTGGGTYCAGTTGVAVGLSNSETATTYQLYNGSAVVSTMAGTGAALNFGIQTGAGTYTVRATNSSACVSNMSGSVVVSVNPMPIVYTVTGGGFYCAGGAGYTVTLNGSNTGINYQLLNGSTPVGTTVAGTGAYINFGLQTAAGFYRVRATNAISGCTIMMVGSPEVVVHSLPVAFNVTGTGSYCANLTGLNVGLSGSTVGVGYRLYNGSTPVGPVISGSGTTLSFGLMPAGTYSVMAINTATTCSRDMNGTAVVAVNALPVAYAVTGGGGYCSGSAGSAVGLSWSQSGVNYQLYNGSATVGAPIGGVNGVLDFGMKTAIGVYSVAAINTTTSCANNMSGTVAISINPLPGIFDASGSGTYCSGADGRNISLSGSETGITYSLYNGTTLSGTPVAGTGAALDFGLHTAGAYTIRAVNDVTTCVSDMTGTVNITMNAAPVTFAVTGGGSGCESGAGVAVDLSGSESGVNYTLYNGVTSTGTTVSGTGGALSFGLHAVAGNYTVLAENTATGCTNTMSGSATVSVNPLPVAYAVTGGGSYCAGGAGVNVGLANSESGISYQLYKGATPYGLAVSGTGGAITFGPQYDNGVYTVMAVNGATTCGRSMTGSVTVNTNAAPLAFNMLGGGAYCAGGTGVTVSLGGSSSGVSYRLYNGATAVSGLVAGSGSAIGFGTYTAAGTYTVLATDNTTLCTRAMSGTAAISINPLPAAQDVTGGGAYCAGGTGVHVGVGGSQADVIYTLYNGATMVGSPMAGTGAALDFGLVTNAGTYTVAASNSTTSCPAAMTGSAVVVTNALPVEYDVTGGGGYCAGGTGVSVALNGSETGVNYQLYHGSTAIGGLVAGTGDLIEFGFFTAAGVYSVAAVNATSTCARNMPGDATVVINTPPIAYAVTGGGNYCAGTAGVHVGVANSETTGTYQLYRDGLAVGSAIAGAGSSIDFGLFTTAGTYTVLAGSIANACTTAMTGNAVVGIHTMPGVFTVSTGGSYCPDAAGTTVSLNGSETGVNYRLYNGATAVGSIVAGTGDAISFGTYPAGSYTVAAVSASSSCSIAMSGVSTISVSTLPTAYAMTGGGGYCSGGAGMAVSLIGSQSNVNYQLYNGAVAVGGTVTGNGSGISFGVRPAGVYSVVATSLVTGCSNNMTGTATVFIHAQPNPYSVTGGGTICAGGTGVNIALNGSQTGVNYRLYNGTTPVGAIVAGTGAELNFGTHTAAGNYTVLAVNTSTTCSGPMSGSATVVVNAAPLAYDVTGGGGYCPGGAGVSIGIAGSEDGISYQLFSGSSMVGAAVTGTGSALDFGTHTTAGTYMVVATNPVSTCTANMTGTATVAVNTQSAAFTLAASGTGYCAGGTGVAFSLIGSQTTATYRLYNGSTPVSPVITGTGATISFGLKTGAGMYSVIATDLLNGCTTTMTGTPSVTINPVPDVFTISGGGSYCAGGAGVEVGLGGSQSGINYQLYNGTAISGSTVAGTGAPISFGSLPAGTYTVQAIAPGTNCKTGMTGAVAVNANPLPTLYAVTGGGQYCAGGTGVSIGISGSSTGIQYRLYNGSTLAGLVAGTGAVLTMGTYTAAGIYTVTATDPITTCSVTLTGNAAVTVNPAPGLQTVIGGGTMCAGTAGVAIGLGGSTTGINYRVYNGATPVGAVVAGNGSVISLGAYTVAGVYTVLATDAATSCSRAMTGAATVIVNATPVLHAVVGGGNYCSGSTGVAVGLGTSSPGVNYRLYNGATALGTVAGTGGSITFGAQIAIGVYTVRATDAVNGCSRAMSGSATIGLSPSVVPSVMLTATTGDSVCAGSTVSFTTAITNGGSAPAYTWMVNGVAVTGSSDTYSYVPANGDEVTVSMTSSAACAVPATVTDVVTLTVNANQLPVVTAELSIDGDTLCEGTNVTFTASALFGGDSPLFTWIKNGVPAGTSATFSYIPANGDVIYVRMTSNYACRTASLVSGQNDTLHVVLPIAPEVSITANPGTSIAKGQSLTLTASVTNGFMQTYQWFLNGGVVHAATTAVFTYSDYTDQDTVTCRVTNNTPCGGLESFNTVLINVSSVGVAHVGANAFDVRVMPNPTKGDFTIKGMITAANAENVAVEITDMLGLVVYRTNAELKNGAINQHVQLTNGLANGMYMVTLRSADATKVFHVVLEQ